MNKYIAKKFHHDEHNDSLLQQPSIKKFIGVSEKIPNNIVHIKSIKRINFKSFNPKVQNILSNSRKKISLMSPSTTRISFFTKYQKTHPNNLNQSKITNEEFKPNKKYKSTITMQNSRLLLKSLPLSAPEVNLVKRRLSLQTLKPKSQVDRIMKLRRKNIIENPFLESIRQSEFV